jgi:type III pantothenate kinase
MPIVSVDIGNSSIKLVVDHTDANNVSDVFSATDQERQVANSKLAAKVLRVEKSLEFSDKQSLLNEHFEFEADPCNWFVCSVDSEQTKQLRKWVQQDRPGDTFHVITADEIELEAVPERKRIGRDRLLSGWISHLGTGGSHPVIVADAGTAVTVDVVDTHGQFLGGLIYPGSHVCLHALSNQTDALPDLSKTQIESKDDLAPETVRLGDDTDSAILLGVHQLQVFGLIGIINQLQQQHPNAKVVITGGGIGDKLAQFPSAWTIVPNLVLLGAAALGEKKLNASD